VARVAITPVRVSPETRDALTRLRLRISGEIGINVTMGDMIAILIEVGKKHYPDLIPEAESRRKND
jgi:hypothetical protein